MKNDKKTKVSIICNTYNHEDYIRDALNGFITQKTKFPFEVIIHDDASTDNTRIIIQEYVEKYPNIFKPIYEDENQYSKNVRITDTIDFPKCRGEYIAICEGDDYWIDEHKLQKQVDFLEKNIEYSAVVHNSYYVDMTTGKKWQAFAGNQDKKLRLEDIIEGGGTCFQTSSLVLRRSYFLYPDEFKINGVGDYPRTIYLMLNGGIYYLKETMSVYRANVPGSWTERNASVEKTCIVISNFNAALNKIDVYTQGSYHKLITKTIKKNEARKLILEKKYIEVFREYREVVKEWPMKKKMRFYRNCILEMLMRKDK